MKLVLSRRALRQLDDILDYISTQNQAGAERVQARIKAVMEIVLRHPLAGTETGHRDGRRIVTNPYPYVVYYRVRGDEVLIQRIRHTARRPI